MAQILGPSKPISGSTGDHWVDPTTDQVYFFDGSSFKNPQTEFLTYSQGGTAVGTFDINCAIWTCPVGETWQVTAANARFGTAGGASAAVTVEVCAAAVASGSGTAQLGAAMSLTGTADTVVNGALIAAPNVITAGQMIGLVWSGTRTALAKCSVTVEIRRIS